MPESKLLVQLRGEKDAKFNSLKVHKRIWCDIAKEMSMKGYDVTTEQCENKWKAIRRKFREMVDHNRKTGNDRQTCPFQDELDAIYGTKENVNPSFTLGCWEKPTEVSRVSFKKNALKKLPTLDFLEKINDENKKHAESREKLVLQMHKEKMDKFDKLLDILGKQTQK